MVRRVALWSGVGAWMLSGCTGMSAFNNASFIADQLEEEVVPTCSIRGSGDADGDGVCDPDDACVGYDDLADGDADGVADGCDTCPEDPLNDDDGDGICAAEDTCPGFDDRLDDDGDKVPDGCDDCPDDVVNDADGDGSCSFEDPCPDDADDSCTHTIVVGTQVDQFFSEARWELQSQSGTIIRSGDYSAPFQGGFEEVEVPVGAEICVAVYDNFGDGGIDGFLYNLTADQEMLSWTNDSYTSNALICETVGGPQVPEATLPYDEADWSQTIASCPMRVSIDAENWGYEIFWSIDDSRGNQVMYVPDGTYASYTANNFTDFDLYPGTYTFNLGDTYGDGWHGGTFEIGIRNTGNIFASGTLVNGSAGTEVFTVSCP